MIGIILILLSSFNTLFCFNLSSGRWTNSSATILFSSTMGAEKGEGLKDQEWINEAKTAFSRWTMVDGATFSIVYSPEDCGNNCTINNNKNELYWMDPGVEPINIPTGALAVTLRRQYDNNMVEVDIVINKSFDQVLTNGHQASPSKLCVLGGGPAPGYSNCFDFPSVVTHEIGHLFGLDHSSEDPDIPTNDPRRTATMYYSLSPDGSLIPLKSDDDAGMICLYPVSGDPYKVQECCESYNPFDRAPGCSHAFSENSVQSLDIGSPIAGCASINKIGNDGDDDNNINKMFLILSIVIFPMFILLLSRFVFRKIGKRI